MGHHSIVFSASSSWESLLLSSECVVDSASFTVLPCALLKALVLVADARRHPRINSISQNLDSFQLWGLFRTVRIPNTSEGTSGWDLEPLGRRFLVSSRI